MSRQGSDFIRPAGLLFAGAVCLLAAPPISLHPDNPHYFLFHGKPTVLITSAEHYGAVINLDFDYKAYLKELAAHRLNNTRTFAGPYFEVHGSFRITSNTLAPKPGRFISPWAQKDGKFDLTQWNPAYFARLKDFMAEAGRRGVVVEFVLFCPYYRDEMWDVSPLNAKNNVNGIGNVGRTEALTLKDPALTRVQEEMVRKIVTELRDFDNLFYEICNEPYAGKLPPEFQRHISKVIADTEATFPQKHLISQNISNGSIKVEDPDPRVSVFQFHYSRPPDSVAMNYGLNKPIGMNETGFDGQTDAAYRIQGWDFILAGGALYNNLDYSFAPGFEAGTFRYPETQPGGGSRTLRAQLRHLREFMESVPFTRMKPLNEVIKGGVPEGASARALAAPGLAYAIYLHHGRVEKQAKPRYQVDAGPRNATLLLELPAGEYRAEWVNPKTGKVYANERFGHTGGDRQLKSPSYTEDIALRVTGRR
jgi:hypothetical protein